MNQQPITAAAQPGPWLITTILHNHATQYAVARTVSRGRLEYVCAASGRPSSFKTMEAARRALRAAKAAA